MHFNDFPTVALQNNSTPLNCRGLAMTEGESPLLHRGREILSPLSVHSASPANWGKGGDKQVFMWHGAYRGQPRYCPTSTLPHPGLIVPVDQTHCHVVTPLRPKITVLHQPPVNN